MAKAKSWSELSPAYRRRLEREQERAAKEGRPFDRKRARGKPPDEYAQRKARRVAKFGVISAGQIRQLRSFGANDEDITRAAKLSTAKRAELIANQRDYWYGRKRGLRPEHWESEVPPVMYWYHALAPSLTGE